MLALRILLRPPLVQRAQLLSSPRLLYLLRLPRSQLMLHIVRSLDRIAPKLPYRANAVLEPLVAILVPTAALLRGRHSPAMPHRPVRESTRRTHATNPYLLPRGSNLSRIYHADQRRQHPGRPTLAAQNAIALTTRQILERERARKVHQLILMPTAAHPHTIRLRHRVRQVRQLRPVVRVEGRPERRLSWLCGFEALGERKCGGGLCGGGLAEDGVHTEEVCLRWK